MRHPSVTTRAATSADLPVLVTLAQELDSVGGRAERAVNPVELPDIRERLTVALDDPDCHLVIACFGSEPAGMAVLRAVRPDPLSDSRVLHLSHLVVTPSHRRRGVGRALIAAAADAADARGIDHVGVGVYPSLRDASRFYARLGFAPVLVQRVAPVSVLRRRLAGDTSGARVDGVVRRRNRLRRPLPPRWTDRPAAEPAGPAVAPD